jgi:hypothetical protein
VGQTRGVSNHHIAERAISWGCLPCVSMASQGHCGVSTIASTLVIKHCSRPGDQDCPMGKRSTAREPLTSRRDVLAHPGRNARVKTCFPSARRPANQKSQRDSSGRGRSFVGQFRARPARSVTFARSQTVRGRSSQNHHGMDVLCDLSLCVLRLFHRSPRSLSALTVAPRAAAGVKTQTACYVPRYRADVGICF